MFETSLVDFDTFYGHPNIYILPLSIDLLQIDHVSLAYPFDLDFRIHTSPCNIFIISHFVRCLWNRLLFLELVSDHLFCLINKICLKQPFADILYDDT